jgi:hypothetical protein
MEGSADQRKYVRYPLGLEAKAVVGNKTTISKCLISTISHSGAAMNLHVDDKLAVGQNMMLEILFPGRQAPIHAIVKLKWFDMLDGDEKFNAAAGGVLVFIKDEDRAALLDYAFKQFITAETL